MAVKREKFTPIKNSFLCSEHFLEADYNYPTPLPQSESLKKKYLKKEAIPSVFKFPGHLRKAPIKERNPKKREFPNPEPSTVPAPPLKTPRFEHAYASNISPKKLNEELTKKN